MGKYLDELLFELCDELQLSPTLYEQATERYKTITNILQKNDVFKNTNLKMYAHGSFRTKTTVKPLKEDEYDLDFVVELPCDSKMSPKELYDNIHEILLTDGIHNEMVETKNRCVRINYANDFHMDIMPGKLIDSNTKEIIVPDKELTNWYHHSNPIGFADWFENQAKKQILNERKQRAKSSFEVEKVSEQEDTVDLEPLRRAVQLIKRYRDIYCDLNSAEPVRSIVLCALMGKITSFTGSTIDIITRFCEYVNSLIVSSGDEPFMVKNPVVDEILTEKWKEKKNYNDFVSMINALTRDINELRELKINKDIHEKLKKMFGEKVINESIKTYVARINQKRENEELAVTKEGILDLFGNGVRVKKNTFYGE